MTKFFLRSRSIFTIGLILAALAVAGFAQTEGDKQPEKKPEPTPAGAKGLGKAATAEQVAETSIFFYGGRAILSQIRKTTQERGTSVMTNAEGKPERANYQRFVIRADTLGKEKIRLDLEFPTAKYSLVHENEKIYGIYNNTVFAPREDVLKAFENQIVHSIEALQRYKEDESKIELAEREKLMGVDYHVLDLTDKHDRKTRYYISAKYFRVMMLTYEEGGVKYRRKFYDHNYAQGTLVPSRTVLWAGDKIVEETEIGTITFGQKVDEGLFNAS